MFVVHVSEFLNMNEAPTRLVVGCQEKMKELCSAFIELGYCVWEGEEVDHAIELNRTDEEVDQAEALIMEAIKYLLH